MAKTVYDVTASEMDFIRLCERLGTEERVMGEGVDMEISLRMSLFRNGFSYAMQEMLHLPVIAEAYKNHRNGMNDADYAAGYSCGSTIAEQAMENYRQILIGGGK